MKIYLRLDKGTSKTRLAFLRNRAKNYDGLWKLMRVGNFRSAHESFWQHSNGWIDYTHGRMFREVENRPQIFPFTATVWALPHGRFMSGFRIDGHDYTVVINKVHTDEKLAMRTATTMAMKELGVPNENQKV